MTLLIALHIYFSCCDEAVMNVGDDSRNYLGQCPRDLIHLSYPQCIKSSLSHCRQKQHILSCLLDRRYIYGDVYISNTMLVNEHRYGSWLWEIYFLEILIDTHTGWNELYTRQMPHSKPLSTKHAHIFSFLYSKRLTNDIGILIWLNLT